MCLDKFARTCTLPAAHAGASKEGEIVREKRARAKVLKSDPI